MARINKVVKSIPTFAIVVDGDCESWYINMLKRNEHAINVHLKPEIPQKKSLSDQYKKIVELARHYDKVIWILDFDVINSETRKSPKGGKTTLQEFKEYKTKITTAYKNILIIINNPCLEYWLLLHFENTNKYFPSCDASAKQLKRHMPDYEKSQRFYTRQGNDIYLRLKPNLNSAIVNSSKLKDFDLNSPDQSIAEMYKLFSLDELKPIFTIPKGKAAH
jgi:hypothetical protein